MTVINGVRMSKYDIRALRVGLKVTLEMLHDLTEFNRNYVGEHSVFPVKNGAPRILEQFRDIPILWNFSTNTPLATSPRGCQPWELPTIKASPQLEKYSSISFAPLPSWRNATIQDVSLAWS